MKIVVNKQGQVFSGLLGGLPVFSDDWDKAKPLHENSTTILKQYNKGLELIEESEL